MINGFGIYLPHYKIGKYDKKGVPNYMVHHGLVQWAYGLWSNQDQSWCSPFTLPMANRETWLVWRAMIGMDENVLPTSSAETWKEWESIENALRARPHCAHGRFYEECNLPHLPEIRE